MNLRLQNLRQKRILKVWKKSLVSFSISNISHLYSLFLYIIAKIFKNLISMIFGAKLVLKHRCKHSLTWLHSWHLKFSNQKQNKWQILNSFLDLLSFLPTKICFLCHWILNKQWTDRKTPTIFQDFWLLAVEFQDCQPLQL